MAVFDTTGSPVFGNAPALNSYSFFQHQLRYAATQSSGSYIYSDAAIGWSDGAANFYYGEQLTGTGFISTPQPAFSLTVGTVTGYEIRDESFSSLGHIPLDFENKQATGLAIDAPMFWSLASSGQWRALWEIATAGDDTFHGREQVDNLIWDDFIEGGGGSDTILGNSGHDQLWGNAGRDFIYGGAGFDILVGNDWAAGGAGAQWDELYGGDDGDYLFTGAYGNGYLVGGAGDDRAWGGPQSDVIDLGAGFDYAVGGGGIDVFVLGADSVQAGVVDFILDFQDSDGVTADFVQLAAGFAWTIVDTDYGAYLSTDAGGGTGSYGVYFSYATAAQVTDQLYYV